MKHFLSKASQLLAGIAVISISTISSAILASSASAGDKLPWDSGYKLNVSQGYNVSPHSTVSGLTAIDFTPISGTSDNIRATQGGTLLKASLDTYNAYCPVTRVTTAYGTSYGNLVKIKNDDGSISLYAHLSSFNSALAGKGSEDTGSTGIRINQGDILGQMGFTGCATGKHLHLEKRLGTTQNTSTKILFDETGNAELQSGDQPVSGNSGQVATPTSPATLLPASYAADKFLDLDGDSRSNIYWRNNQGNNIVWQINQTGTNTGYLDTQSASGWTILGYGYFAGNNQPKILWQNQSNNDTAIWNLNPNGTYNSTIMLRNVTGWKFGGIGEYSNGKDGIFWINPVNNDTVIWNLDANGYSFTTVMPNISGWEYIATGSFSGSGKRNNILFKNKANGDVVYWNLNPNGTYNSTVSLINAQGFEFTGLGKFSSNVRDNIIWRNGVSTYMWNLNQNGGYGGTLPSLPNTQGWTPMGVGKFNSFNSQENLVWKNLADGTTGYWNFNPNGSYNSFTGFTNTNTWNTH